VSSIPNGTELFKTGSVPILKCKVRSLYWSRPGRSYTGSLGQFLKYWIMVDKV